MVWKKGIDMGSQKNVKTSQRGRCKLAGQQRPTFLGPTCGVPLDMLLPSSWLPMLDVVEWGLKYFKLNLEPAIPNNTFLSHKSLTRRYVQGNHSKYRESKQYISAEGISWDRNIVLIFYIYDDYQERKNVIALNRSSITLHADQKGPLVLIRFQNKDIWGFFFPKATKSKVRFQIIPEKYTLRDLRHAQTKLT